MGSRAAGTMRVWRKWTFYHKDIAKRRWEQARRNHLGCGQKGLIEPRREEKAFGMVHVLDLQCHFHFRSSYFKHKPTNAGEFRKENHTHNLIPEGMNSRGTNKQANKIILHLYNSEKGNSKKGLKWKCSKMEEWAGNMAHSSVTYGTSYPQLLDLLPKSSLWEHCLLECGSSKTEVQN